MQTTTTNRAFNMYTLYMTGATLQEIADRYHITRERVRQVIRDYCKMAQLSLPPRYATPMQRLRQQEKVPA